MTGQDRPSNPLSPRHRTARVAVAVCVLVAGCGRKPAEPPAESPAESPAPPATGSSPPAVVYTPPAGETPAGPVAPRRQEHYPFRRAVVLTIGVNEYPGVKVEGLGTLRYAEADARAVGEVLDRLYGYEVVLLPGAQATKANIERELERLGSELGDGDVLVVYFAGHGVVVESGQGGEAGYLVPADATLGPDDRRHPERWAAQALDMRELGKAVEKMKARHVLVIADACCSGFMTTRGAFSRADLKTFLFGTSRAVFAATTQSQRARESEAAGHGHFTAALLDQLRRDEAMSVVDLYAPVLRRVADETNGTMTPQLGHFGNGEGMFVFIPKSIPRSEIEAELGGRTPGSEPDKRIACVVTRQQERLGRATTEEDVYRVMVSWSYAFAPRAEDLHREWEKRFTRFQENAATGNPWAMAALHFCYARGLGTPKNPDLAYYWARQLDGFGKPAGAGRFCLGGCYRLGLVVEKLDPAADRLYRESADLGFLPAKVYLAEVTLRGKAPAAENIAAAKKTLEEGRGRKYSLATLALGRLHDGTIPGIKPDHKTALELFEEAAGLGNPQAMVAAYRLLGAGRSEVPRDAARAEQYLRQAADLGDPPAQYWLGLEYHRGHPERVLSLQPDDREKFRWLLLAAEQGHLRGQCWVALCYADGTGTERNVELARQWCARAVEKNSPDGFFLQGEWYRDGRVLGPKDKEKAAERFSRAADLGHPRAAHAYVLLYRIPETGGFVFRTANWMEILRYATRAAMVGNLQPKDASDLIRDAYKSLIQGQGTTDAVRWSQFEKTYPDEAREMARRLGLPTK